MECCEGASSSPTDFDLKGAGGVRFSNKATKAFSTCASALAGDGEGLWRLHLSEQNLGAVFVVVVVALPAGVGVSDVFAPEDDGRFRFEEIMRPHVWQ